MKRRTINVLTAALLVIAMIFTSVPAAVFADPVEETTAAADTETQELPSSYDLRNVDGKCYVTPVRSQAPFGTCWSFATVAALESSILAEGLNGADGRPATPETLNLSEKQIAWFSAMPLRDPGNSQNGEGQYIADFITEDALVEFMNRGGNEVFSANALAQGIGPSHESTDPYLAYHGKDAVIDHAWENGEYKGYSYSMSDDWRIPDEYRFVSDYSVKEARFLPEPSTKDEEGHYVYCPEGTEAIKRELMEHRAVQVNFCADASMPGQDSEAQYISENWVHYTYLPVGTNHAVTIIGWDDNYSKDNFIQGTIDATMIGGETIIIDKAPPADGAWLVKNSWGSGLNGFPDNGGGAWGIVDENGVHTGYFWLSYYDQTLSCPVSYIVEEADLGVDHIDQYDYMQIATNDSYLSDDEMKMANAYYAEHNEALEAVSCMTSYPGMTVTYEIYLLNDNSDKAEDGFKVAERTVTYDFGGFHKESIADFDMLYDITGTGAKEILVPKGQRYSIIVTQKTKEGKYALNYQYSQFSEGGGIESFKGVLNEQECWYYKDGEWFDYALYEEFRDEIGREMFVDLVGEDYLDYYMENMTYDNFPIKGFCRTFDDDCMMYLKGNVFLYYDTDKYGSSYVRLDLHTTEDDLPDVSPEDFIWGLEKGGEEYVLLEKTDNPAAVKVTALNADDQHVTGYVTVKGIGTLPFYIYVQKLAISAIFFPVDFETGEPRRTFEYTGTEIEAAEDVECLVQPVIKDLDYRFVYEDNVKCGLATVRVELLSERMAEIIPENIPTETFVIVPRASEIESVTADGGKLTVKVKDQSECGLTGYRVEYRAEGEDDWQEVTFPAPETETVIEGLKGETNYEVRVSGYVEIPEDAMWYYDPVQYGKASEVAAVTTGEADAPEEPESSKEETTEAASEDAPDRSGEEPVETEKPAETDKAKFNSLIIWIVAGCAILIIIIAIIAAVLLRKKREKAEAESAAGAKAEENAEDKKE
ncbi:MAG: fibronectin type III domain-containing protein [Lachnospiraceae bacterium]|nr:fibronectin type III domain-containing protein [Lachnospiraceae bacterium]